MAQQHFPANREIEMVLLALQVFQVLFLWVQDWIPLGRLNDVAAVRSQDTRHRLVTVTLIQSVPWTIGLCFSLLQFRRPYPGWLYDWLVISYGLLFIGQIRAWWIPYLFRPEPERAARHQIMFGKTHSFLPPRNGMVPNTAHTDRHPDPGAAAWNFSDEVPRWLFHGHSLSDPKDLLIPVIGHVPMASRNLNSSISALAGRRQMMAARDGDHLPIGGTAVLGAVP